ncbi:Lrp/AsnC family transcriptional regulator [Egicoccus sp. AB-alg2]|uniref:Lrp/AsnC family transcriptional regulator n=1 Tax=Egicoccus sp. AB-alg2 TaxID=3242693 RepID=UPI00359E788B
MSFQADDVDLELLALLRDDGRASVTALAERLHLSRSAVHQRLERLREAGVVRGFAPVVDSRRLGLGVAAVVLLSAGPGTTLDWETVRAGLLALPHVEYAALMTGEADVLLMVRVADFEELRGFLLEEIRRLTGARGTLTSLVLDEVVRRPFLLPGD